MSGDPGRVRIHVARDGRGVGIAAHDPVTGARATLELRRKAAAGLAACLVAATGEDDDFESEAEYRGSLEVTDRDR